MIVPFLETLLFDATCIQDVPDMLFEILDSCYLLKNTLLGFNVDLLMNSLHAVLSDISKL